MFTRDFFPGRDYAAVLSLWQHRTACRLVNIEAPRDNVALLVETTASIQSIVEREWTTTRRTRSRQVLERWLDHRRSTTVSAYFRSRRGW